MPDTEIRLRRSLTISLRELNYQVVWAGRFHRRVTGCPLRRSQGRLWQRLVVPNKAIKRLPSWHALNQYCSLSYLVFRRNVGKKIHMYTHWKEWCWFNRWNKFDVACPTESNRLQIYRISFLYEFIDASDRLDKCCDSDHSAE